MEMTAYHPVTELAEAKLQLQSRGVTLFSPILSDEELDSSDGLFWETMTRLNPKIDRFDRSTWTNQTFPGEFSTGISGYYGMAQSDYAWYFRLHPVIIGVFSYLLDIKKEQMCCSMDCLNIMFDYRNKKPSWLHRDQAPDLPFGDLTSYQAMYSRYAVGKEDAGFMYVPGSHLLSYQATGKKSHYVPLPLDDPLHRQAIKLLSPQNSLIVFNSKTLHCNSGGSRNRPDVDNQPRLNRLGVYVSYWDKSLRTDKVLETKRQLYLEGSGTSHWGILANKKKTKPRWPRHKNSDPMQTIQPSLDSQGKIPADRLTLI